MSYKNFKYLGIICAVGAIVLGVSQLPPLTTGGTQAGHGVSQAEVQKVIAQELAHCEANAGEVDCECFAGVSGYILSNPEARVPSAYYVDRLELARGQASRRC